MCDEDPGIAHGQIGLVELVTMLSSDFASLPCKDSTELEMDAA